MCLFIDVCMNLSGCEYGAGGCVSVYVSGYVRVYICVYECGCV